MFLCPTTSTGPFPDDIGRFADRTIRTDRGEQAYASLPFWIAHASLTGLPAVSIPIRGSPTGHLPVLSHRPARRGRHRHTSAELATEVIVGHQRPLLLKYPE